MKFKFKEDHSFEERKAEASKIRRQHPDKVPVIIERGTDSQIADLVKKKFLIPHDITVSQLLYIVRKRIKLSEDKAIFLYVGQIIPATSASVGEIFVQNIDEDGFLYVTYRGESTFGQ